MSFSQFITTSLYFLAILISSSLLGYRILSFVSKKESDNHLILIGSSYVIGLIALTYINFVFGYFGFFTKNVHLIVLAASLVFNYKFITSFSTNIEKGFRYAIGQTKINVLNAILVIVSTLLVASLYFSSMQPPAASDELHYHFPQARQIVLDKKIDSNFMGHYFYGNIPKLMEVVFASGIAIDSYSLAHLLNFSIMISSLLVFAGVIGALYGVQSGLLAVFLLLLYQDFVWNGTTGYIDTATSGLEIASLLVVLYWLKKRRRTLLFISGAFIGISLAMKYSPIPTVIIISAIILSQKNIKNFISFFLPAFLFGSYWYLKNLIIFKNPTYPLYFGHAGVAEKNYTGLINAIQEFGPKTFKYYIHLLSEYYNPSSFHVFISFFLFPLALLVKKNRKTTAFLVLYYIGYSLYWFFFATHQIRFLLPAITISLTLLAIFLGNSGKRTFLIIAASIILLLVPVANKINLANVKSTARGYLTEKFHLNERHYAFGNITEKQFLTNHFGCQYSVISYLEESNLDGKVVDNWTVWHAPSVSFYSTHNQFLTLSMSPGNTEEDLLDMLSKSDIRYLYFNEEVKKKYLANTQRYVVEGRDQKLKAENIILENSTLIYEDKDCRLYEIDLFYD